ncbi:MAG: YceI family protein [Marinoscillum sp.]
MKTTYLIIASLLVSCSVFGQSKRLIDSKAFIRFFSEAPMEDIEAINKEALGALDLETGKVAVSMNMKDFHFEKSLMEEHFNENYIESEQYPKATFSGLLKGFKAEDLKKITDSLSYEATGTLNLHGVSKEVKIPVVFTKSGNQLQVKAEFIIRIEEYEIEVPTMLIKNIAEEVLVTSKFSFTLK